MMTKIRHIAFIVSLILGGLTLAGTAQAKQMRPGERAVMPVVSLVPTAPQASPQYSQNRYGQYQTAQAKISYAQAKSIARKRVPGSQVIDVSLNGQTYRVRLQTRDGRVVDVYVDAVTGRVR